MSIWSLASNASAWRGYEYYEQGKITSYKKLDDETYESHIKGSTDVLYHTVINIAHPRMSHCDCPFAKDRRVMCKHMVALLFTVSPDEAKAYIHEVEESEEEEERWRQEHYAELERYVKSLKKNELQDELVNALIELEERDNRYR